MSNPRQPTARLKFIDAGNQLVPTSGYTYAELAEIYNQARVDYIVPMPMNSKRMQEYVVHYDISLNGSVVAINEDSLPCGVGMLGLREGRSWITRLGVIPDRRKHHMGQAIMESLIESAQNHRAKTIQLEVIVGNDPARNLFEKLGFITARELLVIRRPPNTLTPNLAYDSIAPIPIAHGDIRTVLASRTDTPSWIEENQSLLNAGNLHGLRVATDDGAWGWIVFQRSPFQLTHFVLNYSDDWVARALLYYVHKEYPLQDTKIENVDVHDSLWQIYQQIGYLEIFRRTEMILDLK
ncbi:MAG: GNAT family N-acetyltransferase [Phototrophicales bacterium]|nr:GNAT family N-acetyltransferase [Phototrophicales bacterium]